MDDHHWHPLFWKEWTAKAPVLCVDVVLLNKDKEVLFSKRKTSPFYDHWHLPGGIVRKNEKLEDALKRVIYKEIGITDIDIIKMIGIFDDPKRDPRGHFITVAFLVETKELIKNTGPQQEALHFFKHSPEKTGFDSVKIVRQVFKKF